MSTSAPIDEAMTRIAAGDFAALWDLHTVAAPAVRRVISAELRRIGAYASRDDIDGLVLDGVLELGAVARSWKPGGAPPWIYARCRIHRAVYRHVGIITRPIDDGVATEAVPLSRGRAKLTALAASGRPLDLLDEALTRVATERDAAIWLAFEEEQAGGNARPALTVGAEFDLAPATVRKAVQRVRQRLTDCVNTTPRYAALADLAVLRRAAVTTPTYQEQLTEGAAA
jgi:hypothetical protein